MANVENQRIRDGVAETLGREFVHTGIGRMWRAGADLDDLEEAITTAVMDATGAVRSMVVVSITAADS